MHDDRYFTESEMNTKLNNKFNYSGTTQNNIDMNTLTAQGTYIALYASGINQTNLHTPWGETTSSYSSVTHYNFMVLYCNNRITQIAYSCFVHNQGMWYRMKHDANWSKWYKVSIDGHTHDASQITSGTLPVARGGTGVTSINALKTLLGIDTSTQSINKIVTGSYIGTAKQYNITTNQTIRINGLNNILAVIIFSVNRANGYPDTADYSFNSFFGLSIKGMTETGIVLNGNMMTVSGKDDDNDPNDDNFIQASYSSVYLNYSGSKYQYIAFGN